MAFRKAALFLGALLVPAICQDDTENVTEDAGGMEVKFKGKSGKFTIYSKDKGEKDSGKLTFEVDKVEELDSDSKDVKSGSKPDHKFNNFKQFNFTQDTDVTIGTATAAKVAFSSDMSGLGIFAVDTYLITKEGQVSPNLEDPESPKWPVYPGDVKFNIEIKDWTWCTTANDCERDGQFIDVKLKIKGKEVKREGKGGKGGGTGKKKSEAIELGGGIDLEFTGQYMLDGESAIMPDGYPMVEVKGKTAEITFRFSKFSSSVVYDPTMFTSDSESNVVDDNDLSSRLGTSTLGLFALAAAYFS